MTQSVSSETIQPSTETPAVKLNNLVFSYQKNRSPVLDIPHWQVNAGERIFLFGESGSGKSTLLNLLSGTLTPGSGDIRLFGEEFSELPPRKRDKFRARHIGVVFQQFNLIPYLSVKANIEAAAWFAGNKGSGLTDRIKQLVAQLQLPNSVLQQDAGLLSVGQQQRVAIARSLINDPGLLIVDEPTSALDADARDKFMQLLLACCDQSNSTLIFVSHDKSLSQFFSQSVSLRELNRASQEKEANA